ARARQYHRASVERSAAFPGDPHPRRVEQASELAVHRAPPLELASSRVVDGPRVRRPKTSPTAPPRVWTGSQGPYRKVSRVTSPSASAVSELAPPRCGSCCCSALGYLRDQLFCPRNEIHHSQGSRHTESVS